MFESNSNHKTSLLIIIFVVSFYSIMALLITGTAYYSASTLGLFNNIQGTNGTALINSYNLPIPLTSSTIPFGYLVYFFTIVVDGFLFVFSVFTISASIFGIGGLVLTTIIDFLLAIAILDMVLDIF